MSNIESCVLEKLNYDGQGNLTPFETSVTAQIGEFGTIILRLKPNNPSEIKIYPNAKNGLYNANIQEYRYVEGNPLVGQFTYDANASALVFNNAEVGNHIMANINAIGWTFMSGKSVAIKYDSRGQVFETLDESLDGFKSDIKLVENSLGYLEGELNGKINKDGNKGLSENDYTNSDKTLVSNIPSKMDIGASFSISQLDLSKGGIGTQHITEELRQSIAGNAPIRMIPENQSVTNEKVPNNMFSVHKLLNPQIPIITNTISFNTETKIIKLIHPTYTIIDNLISQKAVNITTKDIELKFADNSIVQMLCYDYFAKTLSVRALTDTLTMGDKVVVFYYKGVLYGYNSHLIESYSKGDFDFSRVDGILNNILNNPFNSRVNVKILGDSITAGVGCTGYGLTTEPIGASTKFVPLQNTPCWANKTGQRISNLFSGVKIISPLDKKINYTSTSTMTLQKNKQNKLFARVNCRYGFNFNINANKLSLYFSKNNGSGIVEILSDGKVLKTIDLYSSSEIYSYKVDITGLSNNWHNIEVKVVGKNSQSISDRVNFEGIEVERFVQYKNMGVAGVDTEWIDYYRTDLINATDDIIIIQIGTNDRIDFVDPSAIELYLGNTIEYIKSLKKEVILLSSCPAEQSMENLMFTMSDVFLTINKICVEHGVTHISNYKGMNDYCNYKGVDLNSLLADKLHPNDKGYDVMYRNVCNEMGIPNESI